MKIKRYKIIAEYKHFYLTEDDKGCKETFDKIFYKPTANGYIEVEQQENKPMPQMARKRLTKYEKLF